MKILFLPGSLSAPASRFRILQFIPYFKQLGYDIEVRVTYPERYWQHQFSIFNYIAGISRVISAKFMLRDVDEFDIIFMNRDIVPEISIEFLEKSIFRKNPHLIFDFDDAIFLGNRCNKLKSILPLFSAVIAGNEYLASFARELNSNVHVWPTVVDTDIYTIKQNKNHSPPRLGWTGSLSSFSICKELTLQLLSALIKLIKFEFVMISDGTPDINIDGLKVHHYKWTAEMEAQLLHEFDIGLMLLNDEPYEKGKCGAKLIQYGAVGIPSIASDVGVNSNIVLNLETGYIVNGIKDAIDHAIFLMNDERLCLEMGHKARKHIEKEYSIISLIPRMTQLFKSISAPE